MAVGLEAYALGLGLEASMCRPYGDHNSMDQMQLLTFQADGYRHAYPAVIFQQDCRRGCTDSIYQGFFGSILSGSIMFIRNPHMLLQ